jgi:hypothetical protein
MKIEWFDSAKKSTGETNSISFTSPAQTHVLSSSWVSGNPSWANVTYTLNNGGVIGPFFVQYSRLVNTTIPVRYSSPATTLPPLNTCVIITKRNFVAACRPFRSVLYQWWDAKQALSVKQSTSGYGTQNWDMTMSNRPPGATQVQVQFYFPDNLYTDPIFLSYPPADYTSRKVSQNRVQESPDNSEGGPGYTCSIAVQLNTVIACKQFSSLTYHFARGNEKLSTLIPVHYTYPTISYDLTSTPFPNAEYALATFVLIDGKTTDPVRIPLNGAPTRVLTMAR